MMRYGCEPRHGGLPGSVCGSLLQLDLLSEPAGDQGALCRAPACILDVNLLISHGNRNFQHALHQTWSLGSLNLSGILPQKEVEVLLAMVEV